MKRFINIAGAIYVIFALVTAHTALAPLEKASSVYADRGSVVEVADVTVFDSQRLDDPNTQARRVNAPDLKFQGPCDDCDDCDKPRTDKSCYTIQLWTASWCTKCPVYKAAVQPALLKLGYTVVVKDWEKDSKERPELRAVPAVCIYYKGEPITIMIAPTVAKIDKFVEGHMPDTPDTPDEPDEAPEDIY